MQKLHFVLMPGLDGTGDLSQPLIETLPETISHTVVSYPRDQCLNYSQLEQLVRTTLPVNHPFVLLAESFSGPLAIRIAASSPQNLHAVILSTSFVRSPVAEIFQLLPPLINRWLFRLPPSQMLLKTVLLGGDCPPALLKKTATAIRSVAPVVLAFRLREVLRVDVTDELQSVSVPLLYLQGRTDRVVSEKSWQEIFRLRPDAFRVMIDAPHLLMQRKPAKAFSAIRDFLSALPEPQ